MIETVPDNTVGNDCLGYALLAIPSDKSKRVIVNLLDDLKGELPGIIWCAPPSALHITLYEIIQASKQYPQDKELLYAEHRYEYENLPVEILAPFKKIRVTFDIIEASSNAIIVRGSDDGIFDDIRSRLAEKLPMPAETKAPPSIIHSSIARYTKAVDLAEVQKVVQRHQVSFEEYVSEFALVKVLKQSLLKYEVIKTYPLA